MSAFQGDQTSSSRHGHHQRHHHHHHKCPLNLRGGRRSALLVSLFCCFKCWVSPVNHPLRLTVTKRCGRLLRKRCALACFFLWYVLQFLFIHKKKKRKNEATQTLTHTHTHTRFRLVQGEFCGGGPGRGELLRVAANRCLNLHVRK